MIDVETLHRLFSYDPVSGILRWKIDTGKKRLVGKEAGASSHHGYKRVGVFKSDLYVHRIVWAMVHGKWPAKNIDHVNGEPSDNRIVNLRECNQSQNIANSKPKAGKYKGVWYSTIKKAWAASIMVNYKSKTLGYFSTETEAANCYAVHAKTYFGEFARTS